MESHRIAQPSDPDELGWLVKSAQECQSEDVYGTAFRRLCAAVGQRVHHPLPTDLTLQKRPLRLAQNQDRR